MKLTFLTTYERIINWLHLKLDKKQFLLFSSVLVGITAGLAAITLKVLVHYIHVALTADYHIRFQYYLYVIFPTVGILATVFYVKRYLKGKLGRGTSNILYGIAKKSGFLPRDQMYSHIITSALTVGFGGSGGLESPIVTTGSAIGSNYSKKYHVNYKDRTLLLACGAAAGIAAAFNAPIAGVLFALEVLLVDVSISAFIPLIVAAASGALLSKVILREDILLSFKLQQPFDYHNVPLYVVLGILAGLVSVYYARVFTRIESFLRPQKKNIFRKALTGGLALGILILFFPPLFGEGYESIKTLSLLQPEKLFEHSILSWLINSKWMILLLVVFTMFFKTIAAAITVGSGGNCGNFAPSLFVGAYLGFAFSMILKTLGFSGLPESNFTIVAMAGILSGVFYSPLTAIFLIAEITGGYELMIPLMIVSATSYTITRYFEPYSMDTKKLTKKGHIFPHSKDKTILSSLRTSRIIETDFQPLSPDATLRQLVDVIAHSKRNIFPVVAEDKKLAGIVLLDNVREVIFKHEMYDTIFVKELMRAPLAVISPDEEVQSVMKKFDETGAWNLPVIEDDHYIGFVSKSGLLAKYRDKLIRSSAD